MFVCRMFVRNPPQFYRANSFERFWGAKSAEKRLVKLEATRMCISVGRTLVLVPLILLLFACPGTFHAELVVSAVRLREILKRKLHIYFTFRIDLRLLVHLSLCRSILYA